MDNEQEGDISRHISREREDEHHEETNNAVGDFVEEDDGEVASARMESVSSFCCPICLEEDYHCHEEGTAEASGAGNDSKNQGYREGISTRKPFLIRGAHCSHGFCKPCLERLLLTPPTGISARHEHDVFREYHPADRPEESRGDDASHQNTATASVTIRGVPTQGSCPMCRARLSLFDLRWLDRVDDDGNEPDTGAGKLVYAQETGTNWTLTPLLGKVFAPKEGVGWASFHFEPSDSSTNLPYFNLENVIDMWTRTARSPAEGVPAKRTPLQQIRWHGPSMTLNAVMNVSDAKYDSWEVILCFCSSLQFVRAGAIVKKWKAPSSRTELHRTFPLDGTWKTTLSDSSEPSTIRVVGNCFVEDGQMRLIRAHLGDSKVTALSTDHRSVDVHADWDWKSKPTGPTEGETIQWTYVKGPHQGKKAQWTLLQKASKLPPPPVEYLGGASGRDYRLHIPVESFPRSPPTYHAATLWGNVFCQAFTVGLASYHFPEPHSESEAPYISYEHPSTSRWPPLDNGTPVPSRVPFRDPGFDGQSRTFRGSIRWLEDYGTTWQHTSAWEYEIRFDERFTCIVGGHVKSHHRGSVHGGSDQIRELSRYGENLVYINAALYEHFCSTLLARSDYHAAAPAIDAGQSQVEQTLRESAQGESLALRHRLQEEGASVRTIAAVHRVWTAARSDALDETGDTVGSTADSNLELGNNPIDFNLG